MGTEIGHATRAGMLTSPWHVAHAVTPPGTSFARLSHLTRASQPSPGISVGWAACWLGWCCCGCTSRVWWAAGTTQHPRRQPARVASHTMQLAAWLLHTLEQTAHVCFVVVVGAGTHCHHSRWRKPAWAGWVWGRQEYARVPDGAGALPLTSLFDPCHWRLGCPRVWGG